jgi:PAS domain S-box-containing protein
VNRRNQPLSLIASSILLLVLVVAAFWQTSLDFGDFRPDGPAQTVVLWGISTLVVLGVLGLGFMVVRSLIKLYLERQRNQLGSRIRTKLVAGALALSILPVACMVYFSFVVLNRTLDKWFSRPTKEVLEHSQALTDDVMKQNTVTAARWAASMPEVKHALETNSVEEPARAQLRAFTDGKTASYVALVSREGGKPLFEFDPGDLFQGPLEWRLRDPGAVDNAPETEASGEFVYAAAPVWKGDALLGRVVVAWKIPRDLLDRRAAMQDQYSEYASLEGERRDIRYFYSSMLALIGIFVVFVATWLALLLSRQISVPIEALVQATGEVSSGHLDYRVRTPAMDELASLVQSFNEMTRQLESKTQELQQTNKDLGQANVELDARRRFIDAILENIAPGVISISHDGEILKSNSALHEIFPAATPPRRLHDLFPADDFEDILYMMNRARRTGLATREFEIKRSGQIIHLAVTVSALEREDQPDTGDPPGFVIVLEDTTELLRAQKSAAWNEVARRVAHEIKNPLTPIALSAERMSRLLRRFGGLEETPERQKLRERFEKCTQIIVQEVEALRTLVDEFSQFARFPSATPERTDLNAVVQSALDVFDGRLEGVVIRKKLSPDLPQVFVDPRQFKRVMVNLIDNAAEAVHDSWLKEIHISTSAGPLPETVMLVVADSGHGITAEDKQKLFLPYFSTKKRGTGLGLAIVSRILSEHQATIRVEDNRPSGSRFIIEIPTAVSTAAVPAGVRV